MKRELNILIQLLSEPISSCHMHTFNPKAFLFIPTNNSDTKRILNTKCNERNITFLIKVYSRLNFYYKPSILFHQITPCIRLTFFKQFYR